MLQTGNVRAGGDHCSRSAAINICASITADVRLHSLIARDDCDPMESSLSKKLRRALPDKCTFVARFRTPTMAAPAFQDTPAEEEAQEYDYLETVSGAASGRSSPVTVCHTPVAKGNDFFTLQRTGSTVSFLQLSAATDAL